MVRKKRKASLMENPPHKKDASKNRRAKQKGGFAMKEVEALDKVIKFVEMKLEACGSFKDGPEGAALKSVMEYALKLRETR